MAELLWQKPGVAMDAQIQRFLAGDDVVLDREFFLHDIAASGAHAEGLQRIGILSADERLARRYLEFLVETELVRVEHAYKEIGRPLKQYVLKRTASPLASF